MLAALRASRACSSAQRPAFLPRLPVVLALVSLLCPALSWAQGRTDYYNVESPQVHPIELATLTYPDLNTGVDVEVDVLLVVDTPDNALLVYTTDPGEDLSKQKVTRVPTGLEPVSVRWFPELGRFHVANFLGDSITTGLLTYDAVQQLPEVSGVETVEVIDEPLDMTYLPPSHPADAGVLIVTHMTLDTLGVYHPETLASVILHPEPGCHVDVDPQCSTEGVRFRRFLPAATNVLSGNMAPAPDLNGDGEVDEFALKQPWTLGISKNRLYVLGHLGGSFEDGDRLGLRYDGDLWSQAAPVPNWVRHAPFLPDSIIDRRIRGGLGTTNWNMAFDEVGTLYVVGARAQNRLEGEGTVASACQGFVESFLFRVDDPAANVPTVEGRNLNACFTGDCILCGASENHVRRASALAQPTDLAVLALGDGTTQVFVAAFGSDRIGRVTLTGASPDDWVVDVLDVHSPNEVEMAGPRGLALQERTNRLYVLNRVSNSISVIELAGFTEAETLYLKPGPPTSMGEPTSLDPTPDWVTTGRRFLYDARLSGRGFDSCASCHVDGRTDGLAWDLSGPAESRGGCDVAGDGFVGGDCNCDGMVQPFVAGMGMDPGIAGEADDDGETCIPPELLTVDERLNAHPVIFASEKKFMVTQSLQGLLNHELPPVGEKSSGETRSQRLVTNAPYHWRGDRETFLDFRGAFQALLGLREGISEEEMEQFEEFINSIHYPPNPKQRKERLFTGDFGVIGDPNDGDGALKGLEQFHALRLTSGAETPCAHCHALPEGSDNTLAVPFDRRLAINPFGEESSSGDAPLEGAALRGLFQKESRRQVDGDAAPRSGPLTGFEGLGHTGLLESGQHGTMRDFLEQFGGGTDRPSVAQFLHEFDFGTGPIVGRTFTVRWEDVAGLEPARWDLAEAQADLANAGLAVRLTRSGVTSGYAYDASLDFTDPDGDLRRYRLMHESGLVDFKQSRSALLAQLKNPGDLLEVISTPLGSERRVATPSGESWSWALPSSVTGWTFETMVSNSALEGVPCLTDGWDLREEVALQPNTAHTILLYQVALDPADLHHVVPRRFRVAADDLLPGAILHLLVPDPLVDDVSPLHFDADEDGIPDFDVDLDGILDPVEPSGYPMVHLEMPLHPTSDRTMTGIPIWETAVEIDPLFVYRMMAGPPSWEPGTAPAEKGVMAELAGLDYRDAGWMGFTATNDFHSVADTPSFSPADWNWQWGWIVNGDGQEVPGQWVQVAVEAPTCP
ncbi:MAG: hypothetical protein AAF533_13395 [Acidobacteriota bacterium]